MNLGSSWRETTYSRLPPTLNTKVIYHWIIGLRPRFPVENVCFCDLYHFLKFIRLITTGPTNLYLSIFLIMSWTWGNALIKIDWRMQLSGRYCLRTRISEKKTQKSLNFSLFRCQYLTLDKRISINNWLI